MSRRWTEMRRAAGRRHRRACGLLGLLLGVWAGSAASAPDLSSAIPPQPLAAALAVFAHQTRLQVVYVSTIVRTRTSGDVPAGLAPKDALARLLDGTGLSFEFLNSRTVRIFVTPAAAPAAPSSAVGAPKKRVADALDPARQPLGGGTLEDVIITAERRSESSSKVPMSISIVSASGLHDGHITNVPDLSRVMPNVSFTTLGGAGLSSFEIRGVSSQAGNAPIGIYLGDVSLTMRRIWGVGTAEPRFFDLERVEVLRGPQGTLYGGGALGGVIRYIEKRPDLIAFDANAALEMSGTEHGGANFNTEGVLNLPLGKGNLALRLGAQAGHDSGYIDQVSPADLSPIARGINANRWTVGKVALKWQLTDAWSATPAIFLQRFNSNDTDAFFEFAPANQPMAGKGLQPLQTSKTVREPSSDRITISSLTVEGDLGFADLTVIGSRYQREVIRILDGTPGNVPFLATLFPGNPTLTTGIAALNSTLLDTTRLSQQSLEARLASKPYSPGAGWPVSWVAGAIFINNEIDYFDDEPISGITKLFAQLGLDINDPQVFPYSFPGAWGGGDSVYYVHSRHDPSQRALFGELNYYLRPDLRLTFGLRYESEKEAYEHDANYYYVGCGRADLLGNTPGCPLKFNPPDLHFSATTPRAALTWDLSDTKLLYASAAKGYREGSFNRPLTIRYPELTDLTNLGLCDGTPAGCAAIAPVSIKADSLWSYELGSKSRFLGNRLSVDASVYLLRWNNTQQIVVLPVSELDFVENAGHVESYGLELEIKGRPTRRLAVALAGGFNHAAFSEDVPALGSINGVLYAAKGSKVPGVPAYNALLGAEYTRAFSGGEVAFIRGDLRLVGGSRGTFALGDPDFNRPGYATSDVSAGVKVGPVEVSLFAKNFNNTQTVFQRPTLLIPTEAYTMRPRTIGLAVNYSPANK